MKRCITLLAALLLVLSLCASALAATTIKTVYVNVDKLQSYAEPSAEAEKRVELKGGDALPVEQISEDQNWYAVRVTDKSTNQEALVWVKRESTSDSMPQAYCAHSWGDWNVVTAATCQAAGQRIRTCSVCGAQQSEEIPVSDHSWGEWKITTEATCQTAGERTRACSVCGFTQTENYTADHSWSDWAVTTPATCTSDGVETRTCSVCGTQETRPMAMIAHDYDMQVTKEATDHTTGKWQQVCKVCGAKGEEEEFYPEGTLKSGDKGKEVKKLQENLIKLGYLSGKADGKYGSKTEKAVKALQKKHDLKADGIAWPQTQKKLTADVKKLDKDAGKKDSGKKEAEKKEAEKKHNFGPWKVTKPLNRTTDGERTRSCLDEGCNYTQTETVKAEPAFAFGDKGDGVRAIQQIISSLGYDAGKWDGIYGKLMDEAFTRFYADQGQSFAAGHILPADVDNLMDTWFVSIPESDWKDGEADAAPVQLSLEVTEEEGSGVESGIRVFNWKVSNKGADACMFDAILLSYGENPDFHQSNITVVIDGQELQANGKNELKGTFAVADDWGHGKLNFAAMAVTESNGGKWLSNTVSFAGVNATVEPQANAIDLTAPADGIYPVDFAADALSGGEQGLTLNNVTLYSEDVYDIVEISDLQPGDILVVYGRGLSVDTITRENGIVSVNGGLEAGGASLRAEDESNCYVALTEENTTACTAQGTANLPVDAGCVYTDASNANAEPVSATGSDISAAMAESGNDSYNAHNTTIRIADGRVVEINRK